MIAGFGVVPNGSSPSALRLREAWGEEPNFLRMTVVNPFGIPASQCQPCHPDECRRIRFPFGEGTVIGRMGFAVAANLCGSPSVKSRNGWISRLPAGLGLSNSNACPDLWHRGRRSQQLLRMHPSNGARPANRHSKR